MKKNRRALIIDEDEIRRSGIARLLELMDQDFIIDETNDISKFNYEKSNNTNEVSEQKYDLLIALDTKVNHLGNSGIKTIGEKFPESFIVVVLSSDKNIRDILRLLVMGVCGIIQDSCSIDEMQEIIQQVLRGMVIFPSRILDVDESVSNADLRLLGAEGFDVPFGRLTKRQTAVLGLLVQGKSNHEIAERLGIAENTVRVHLSAILKALNASNRTQAAIIASTYLKGVENPDAETS